MRHIVQFSGGKDSTCMLLMMLEKGMPVDDIIFCDTGMEFPQMYEHIDKVEQYIGRKITRLKAENSFEYMMLDYTKTKGERLGQKGYGWATMLARWCTTYFKTQITSRYLKEIKYLSYIGIAYDEPKRHENIPENVRHPLFDWQITEKQALSTCYKHGFTWGGVVRRFRQSFVLVLSTKVTERIKGFISQISCIMGKTERIGFKILESIPCRLQCATTGRKVSA